MIEFASFMIYCLIFTGLYLVSSKIDPQVALLIPLAYLLTSEIVGSIK